MAGELPEVKVVIEEFESVDHKPGWQDGRDEVDFARPSAGPIPNTNGDNVPYHNNTKVQCDEIQVSRKLGVSGNFSHAQRLDDSRNTEDRGRTNVSASPIDVNEIRIDCSDRVTGCDSTNMDCSDRKSSCESVKLYRCDKKMSSESVKTDYSDKLSSAGTRDTKDYRKYSDESIGSIVSTISGDGLICTEFSYDGGGCDETSKNSGGVCDMDEYMQSYSSDMPSRSCDSGFPSRSCDTVHSLSAVTSAPSSNFDKKLSSRSCDSSVPPDRNNKKLSSSSFVSSMASHSGDTGVPELSLPEDMVEVRRYSQPRLHQKVVRSGPLLAPPPRFPLDDEEDDLAWVDLTESACYFECPELLESYRALRPRLSYR